MTTANDLGYDDDDQDGQQDEAAQRRAAFERRKSEREADRKELADLRAEKAERERTEALDKARAELNASGPLALYLRTYTGEPTADAIRKAVAADDEVKDLITFEADPRDTAAKVQTDGAAKVRGADPAGAKALQPSVAPGLDRLRHYHEQAAGAATKT